MSWIADYDTHGREFPTCVHVTKTTGTMTHGATYVPIEDGKAVRAENAKLQELCGELLDNLMPEICAKAHWCRDKDWRVCNDDACGNYTFVILARELGVEC